MNKQQHFIAGLYCRLSKDDNVANESISIETQKIILAQFCKDNNIQIYDYYCEMKIP